MDILTTNNLLNIRIIQDKKKIKKKNKKKKNRIIRIIRDKKINI